MNYQFDVADEKIKSVIEEGLIPVAIARAKLVQPDPSVVPDWEAAIYKDLERPNRRFSWFNWLTGCLP